MVKGLGERWYMIPHEFKHRWEMMRAGDTITSDPPDWAKRADIEGILILDYIYVR